MAPIVLTACASLCKNHSSTCNSSTCFSCSNNTFGSKCELCLDGYYGDAEGGTPNDCQPCECNNLAAICVANSTASNGHQCMGCRSNSIGDQCEDCESGYYNNASGDSLTSCQECLCNGMAETCVSNNTARDGYVCLNCSGNTFGDQCQSCLPRYYNNPNLNSSSSCVECNCNTFGSVDDNCSSTTGMCTCKDGVSSTSRTCDKCADKFFNLTTNGCTGKSSCMYVVLKSVSSMLLNYPSIRYANDTCPRSLFPTYFYCLLIDTIRQRG